MDSLRMIGVLLFATVLFGGMSVGLVLLWMVGVWLITSTSPWLLLGFIVVGFLAAMGWQAMAPGGDRVRLDPDTNSIIH